MKKVAIILPAYNEELTIAATIRAFYQELPTAFFAVIDNNSIDQTSQIASEVFCQLGIDGIVMQESRQGKANAVRKAFRAVDAEVYVLSDADLTYPASQVHDLIAPVIRGDADMVVGDRHSGGDYQRQNKRAWHNFGNSLVKLLVNSLFEARLNDIMSGYRAFSWRFVKHYPVLVDGFELETDMTLHALDKRIGVLEIPVEYRDRPPGSTSKLSTFADGAKVIFTIVQILRYHRPLLFFGTLGLLAGVAGVVASGPVLNDWLLHRYIYHVPMAILAASLGVFSLTAFGIGLILDSIIRIQKFNFEIARLNNRSDSVFR